MAPSIILSESAPSYQPKPGKKSKEASELRKTLKPLMEKRRRARINESLNQLKTLILPLIGKDNSRYSKLEKADILEMTVRFLKDIPPVQTQNSTEKYREGYRACLERLSGLLSKSNAIGGDLQSSPGSSAEEPRALLPRLHQIPQRQSQQPPKDRPAPQPQAVRDVLLFSQPGGTKTTSPEPTPARQLRLETLVKTGAWTLFHYTKLTDSWTRMQYVPF